MYYGSLRLANAACKLMQTFFFEFSQKLAKPLTLGRPMMSESSAARGGEPIHSGVHYSLPQFNQSGSRVPDRHRKSEKSDENQTKIHVALRCASG